jgi:hypothetical protein
MKNISKLSKYIGHTFSKTNPFFYKAMITNKTFSEKVKFNFEDPLNLTSLLTEEEQMVRRKQITKSNISNL